LVCYVVYDPVALEVHANKLARMDILTVYG